MKIIFLDFDGVLNSHTWATRTGCFKPPFDQDNLAWSIAQFDPACVERLNHIVEATDAYIVISSSWRSHTSPKGSAGYLGAILARCGLRCHRKRIIGITPEHDHKTAAGIWVAVNRWEEIKDWLNANPCESFVILDDDFMRDAPEDRKVTTDYTVGLTDQDVKKAIEILETTVDSLDYT